MRGDMFGGEFHFNNLSKILKIARTNYYKCSPVLAKRKIKTQVEIISKEGTTKQQSVKEEILKKN